MYSALCLFVLAIAHLVAMFFVSPTFMHDVIAQTPVRIIALAGPLAIVVQIIKKNIPAVNGRWTLLLSFFGSLTAVLVGLNPAHFWSMETVQTIFSETTLAQVIAVFFMASGTHGVSKGLFGSSDGDPLQNVASQQRSQPYPPEEITGANRGVRGSGQTGKAGTTGFGPAGTLLVLVLAGAVLTGCQIHPPTPGAPPALPTGSADLTDAHANQILQTIQAFMQPIVRDIANGKLAVTPAQRTAVNTLDSYYNKAIVAEQTYHGCMSVITSTPPSSATCLTQSALTGALANAQGAFTKVQTALASSIKQ